MSATESLPGDAPQKEIGASVRFFPVWSFTLGARDTLLVLKALGGRLASKAEEDAAEALGDRLVLLRESEARQTYEATLRAADAVREKGGAA